MSYVTVTSDLRYRMHVLVRHSNIVCYDVVHAPRTTSIYDVVRVPGTYDIVRVRCRTCTTYAIVCNISIIRCRTSDVGKNPDARQKLRISLRPPVRVRVRTAASNRTISKFSNMRRRAERTARNLPVSVDSELEALAPSKNTTSSARVHLES